MQETRRSREKLCPTCGRNFTYLVGAGNDRRHCQDARCQRIRRHDQRAERMKTYPSCATDGCERPANRRASGLCEVCYTRVRRTGTTTPRKRSLRYQRQSGYVALLRRGHPLADSQGYVYEHRLVYFEGHSGSLTCCWCGTGLTWETAVIDHLNEVKHDNQKANLVASCDNCNTARARMLSFLRRLTDEAGPAIRAQIVQAHPGLLR